MPENITETQKRLQIAIMLLDIPDRQAAIDQLEKILEKEPDNPTVNLLLANTYIDSYELAKGIPFLKKVVVAQPENRKVQLLLGQALSWTGMHQEARPILEKLVELDPANPDILETLWGAYLGCGEIQLAEEIYHRLIQVAPDEFAIYEVMHYECLGKKYYDQAIQVAQYMAEKAPVPTYLNILGETLLKADQPEQAILQFEQALKVEEDFEPAWAHLVEAYRQSGQSEKALEIANHGLHKCPNSLDIQEQKVNTLMNLKQWEIALELINALLENPEKIPPARLDRLLMDKFLLWQHIHNDQVTCQMGVDLNRTYQKYLDERYAHYYLLLFVLTETLRKLHSYQEVIELLKPVPIEEMIILYPLPRNYYFSLVASDRLQEAGDFLQKLAAHSEIEIESKIKILDLIEQLAQETLAADQPETLQTVLQQIREPNFLPEAARWQPTA